MLASIVEKETAIPAERPRVAAVYVNRLQRGMALDADPTLVYGIAHGTPLGRGLTSAELAAPGPYNTYLNPGLPPTAIGNPGRASLAAAMDPPATGELYFVASGGGGPSLFFRDAGAAGPPTSPSCAPGSGRIRRPPRATTTTTVRKVTTVTREAAPPRGGPLMGLTGMTGFGPGGRGAGPVVVGGRGALGQRPHAGGALQGAARLRRPGAHGAGAGAGALRPRQRHRLAAGAPRRGRRPGAGRSRCGRAPAGAGASLRGERPRRAAALRRPALRARRDRRRRARRLARDPAPRPRPPWPLPLAQALDGLLTARAGEGRGPAPGALGRGRPHRGADRRRGRPRRRAGVLALKARYAARLSELIGEARAPRARRAGGRRAGAEGRRA